MLHKLLFTGFFTAFSFALWAQTAVLWSEDFDTVTTSLPNGWAQQTAATDWRLESGQHHGPLFPVFPGTCAPRACVGNKRRQM